MAASSIKITIKAEGAQEYLNGVSALVLGNMVDPVTGESWSTVPDGNNPWVWTNDGSNANKFALMANYSYNGTEKTAFSVLVIDPTAMSGDCEVVAELCTAAIGGDENNTILRYRSALVNGEENPTAAYTKDWGTSKPQPASEFYGLNVSA